MAAISVAPLREEVAQSVVDTLLQIAANCYLRPFIPPDVWLWLNERPLLPSVCEGRWLGDDRDIVWMVRALDDAEILTSYLILVWSEWKLLSSDGFVEMCVSIREDLNGIGMGCHRAALIRRLDYILGELDRRSRHLDITPDNDELWCDEIGPHSQAMREKYGGLRKILQEVGQEATEILNRMPPSFIFLSLLTLTDLRRIPPDLHVRPASPVSIASHLERPALCETSHSAYPHSTPSALLVDGEQSQFCPDIYRSGPLDAPVRMFVTAFRARCSRVFCLWTHVLYHLCKTQFA